MAEIERIKGRVSRLRPTEMVRMGIVEVEITLAHAAQGFARA